MWNTYKYKNICEENIMLIYNYSSLMYLFPSKKYSHYRLETLVTW